MLSCYQVADYFLSLQDEDVGDFISNLKLQKLVYYAQGFWLAIHGRPLFDEEIEAWTHGPVVPVLYHHYKGFRSERIPTPTNIDFDCYTEQHKELFDEIYALYGQYSAWKLREMTHNESPWKNNFHRPGRVIGHQDLMEYFKTQLKN